MKIVLIQGGLGNQMFQYAFYRALQVQFPNEEIKVDLSFYKKHHCHNGYELEKIFNLKPSIAKESEIVRCKQSKTYIEQEIKYYLEVFDFDGDVYFNGYWQSEKYFFDIKEQIKKDFSFPMLTEAADKKLSLQIQESNAVSVHIRRGDYLNNLTHHICDLTYYKNAFEQINKSVTNPTFFIISNDIAWCKEHFKDDNIVFIERKKQADAYRDMQMISLCNHHIIANSSFSWWGSYLSKNNEGIKIAPKQWFAIGTFPYYINDILPNGFTKLDVLPEPLVSVIVPVYNVEEYLRECLDSIINQTYTNLEIIIVNDCSPDNSQSIIDEYIKTDKRIQCIKHEKNKGLGEARNTGMAATKGEYISFIDSDDYWDNLFVAIMMKNILIFNSDYIQCNFVLFDNKSKKHTHRINQSAFFEDHSKPIKFSTQGNTKNFHRNQSVIPWARIFKKELINKYNIVFIPHVLEDIFFCYECYYHSNFGVQIFDYLYYYRQNRIGSLSNTDSVFNSTKKYINFLDGIPVGLLRINKKNNFHSHILEGYCFEAYKQYKHLQNLYIKPINFEKFYAHAKTIFTTIGLFNLRFIYFEEHEIDDIKLMEKLNSTEYLQKNQIKNNNIIFKKHTNTNMQNEYTPQATFTDLIKPYIINRRKLKNNAIVYDLGSWKLQMAKYFSLILPTAIVETFDIADHFPEIRKSICKEFPNIKFYNKGISIKGEKRNFIKMGEGSSLEGNNNSNLVECIDFSKRVVTQAENSYVLVKMDIEGSEYDVLEKMIQDKTIHLIDTLIIDWHGFSASSEKLKIERLTREEKIRNFLINETTIDLAEWWWTPEKNSLFRMSYRINPIGNSENLLHLSIENEENNKNLNTEGLCQLAMDNLTKLSLWQIIKRRFKDKLVHKKWAKYPKPVRYGVYALKLVKLIIKKIKSKISGLNK